MSAGATISCCAAMAVQHVQLTAHAFAARRQRVNGIGKPIGSLGHEAPSHVQIGIHIWAAQAVSNEVLRSF
jgi:hypothetical protein